MPQMRIYQPSINAIRLVQHFESCAEKIPNRPGWLRAYHGKADRPGLYTIGWGNTFLNIPGRPKRRVIKSDIISQSQADYMFLEELKGFAVDVNFLTHDIPDFNQNMFDACLSFAYNCSSDIDGDDIAEGLGDSRLLKLIRADVTDPEIAQEFLKWRKSNGKVEPGLIRRRTAEAYLYFKGELKFYFN